MKSSRAIVDRAASLDLSVLALQLPFCFEVRALSDRLVSSMSLLSARLQAVPGRLFVRGVRQVAVSKHAHTFVVLSSMSGLSDSIAYCPSAQNRRLRWVVDHFQLGPIADAHLGCRRCGSLAPLGGETCRRPSGMGEQDRS
jgi:hypothetical protein